MSQAPHGGTLTYWPALDGVRALAVAAVLLFHGGVAWLPGGFLGVDAFFVLSGFLITSLLLTEHGGTGRIRLGAFWLRRARRLLPALLLVLVFVVCAYRTPAVDSRSWTCCEATRSPRSAYVANWRMIYRGDDYFTQIVGTRRRFSTPGRSGSRSSSTWCGRCSWLRCWHSASPSARRSARVCSPARPPRRFWPRLLFDPLDVNRAYFGTDTRAQALLIGCALAAGLMAARVEQSAAAANRRRGPSTAVGVAGITGVMVVGWLWTHA